LNPDEAEVEDDIEDDRWKVWRCPEEPDDTSLEALALSFAPATAGGMTDGGAVTLFFNGGLNPFWRVPNCVELGASEI